MVSFIFYDIIFLIIFAVLISYFLYTRKKNLKREGLLLLYKANWGINLINKVGSKYKRTLSILSYISIAVGYVLMISMFYLLGKIVYIYITLPAVVREIKVPPIIPLVPYLPQIFKLDFLPPFYFTYWIVIIAIIAITHEFAHGIFMRRYDIKIKSTGFGFFPFFLPIFLAAFVEQDEKSMNKSTKFHQLAVLSAGTFANVLTAIIFFIVLLGFFSFAFTPSGVIYDTYPYAIVGLSSISIINGIPIEGGTNEEILELMDEEDLNKIIADGNNFVSTKEFFEGQINSNNILLYYDAPAINANLESIILKINGQELNNIDDLERELSGYSPGDTVTLTLLNDDENDYNKDIVLGKHPEEDKAWLGIGFSQQRPSGVLGKVYTSLSFKKPHIYYGAKYGGMSIFIYNLLWWLILISISVALVNMLPVGIFDGGRFFYLTIWGITGKEKLAKKSFVFSTYFILFLILVLMFFWVFSFV